MRDAVANGKRVSHFSPYFLYLKERTILMGAESNTKQTHTDQSEFPLRENLGDVHEIITFSALIPTQR